MGAIESGNFVLEKETLERLKAVFSSKLLDSEIPQKNRVRVTISPSSLTEVAAFAKKDLNFEHLSSIVGIDMQSYFAAAYMLGSWSSSLMLEIYARIDDLENPLLPSVTSIWKTADWHEREIFDLFGFNFTGHPNLKRILLPEEWDEMSHEDPNLLHPLRKSYKQPENPFRLTRPVNEAKGRIEIDKWRENLQ